MQAWFAQQDGQRWGRYFAYVERLGDSPVAMASLGYHGLRSFGTPQTLSALPSSRYC